MSSSSSSSSSKKKNEKSAAEVPKKATDGADIDALFDMAKMKKKQKAKDAEEEEGNEEEGGGETAGSGKNKRKRSKTSSSESYSAPPAAALPYGVLKSNIEQIISPEAPVERVDPESGYRVYKAHLLKVGEGGGTELCPFDCNCCF